MYSVRKLLMMIRALMLFFILIYGLSGSAQICSHYFSKTYGGSGDDESLFIQSTPDGGSIVAGRTTSSSAGDYDCFLMKLSEDGAIRWSKNYGTSGYDELSRVRLTPDGGYIATGFSKSLGNPNGYPVLLKVDPNGSLQWSVYMAINNTGVNRLRDLIVLRDGSFALLINSNDSTAQGDGIISRLSSSGAVIWSKSFDNGDDDGFNSLTEENDSLVVGGYATIDRRDGILMKISSTTGSVYWAKKYVHGSNVNDEIISVERLPSGGLGFSAIATASTQSFSSSILAHFKRLNDGRCYYQTKVALTAGESTPTENIVSRVAPDNSFIYLVNEQRASGYCRFLKLNNPGTMGIGRLLWNTSITNMRMNGLDTSMDKGYWLSGYYKTWSLTNNKITLSKLDPAGLAGSCLAQPQASYHDTANYDINDFSWSHITTFPLATTAAPLRMQDNRFTQMSTCDTTICENPSTVSDSCKSTYIAYLRSYMKCDLFDVEVANDGGTIVVGRLQTEPFMTKINPDGKVGWTRSYAAFFEETYFKKVIPTKDGNYLVIAISSTVLNHTGYKKSLLLKINNNGDLIWSKDYVLSGILNIYNAVSTDDGGFIVCANFGFGIGYTYSYIMRLSSTGDIVWKKQIFHNAGAPVYKQMSLQGNDLYLGADYYLNSYFFRAERWNATTGQMIWNKRFILTNSAVYTGLISPVGDTVYLLLNSFTSEGWNKGHNNTIVIKLDMQGDLKGSYQLLTPDFTQSVISNGINEHTPFNFLQTPDNNFVVAQQTQLNGNQALTMTKFTPTGTVLWSRAFPNLKKHWAWGMRNDGTNILIGGRMDIDISLSPYQYSSFVMRTDLNGKIKNDATGLCQSDTAYTTIGKVDGLSIAWNDVDSVANESRMVVTPSLVYSIAEKVDVQLQCSLSSSCTKLEVKGMDTICTASDILTYFIERNPGCTAPAAWIVDTSFTQILHFTDSTISVLFKKNGNTIIRAKITSGCSVMLSEKPVTVVQSSTQLSLGSDTVLCPGNTILLNARAGFLSYRWQDGSEDSIYTVQQPGSYFVKVMDACGRGYSDTIVVRLSSPIPFDVGLDRIKCNADTIRLHAPSGFLNYSWSPSYNISATSASDVVINPYVDTAYFIKAEKTPGCFAYDTVRITVHQSPAIHLGKDTSFCAGQSVHLDAGSGFLNYVWNNGATSREIDVNAAGLYSVAARTEQGCWSYDTLKVVKVYNLPKLQLDHQPALCLNTSRTLDPGKFVAYRWQDGSQNRTFTLTQMGTYYITVTDNNGCMGSDTVKVTTILPLPKAFLPADTAICSYGKLTLTPVRSFASYLWSTGETTRAAVITNTGKYWLEVRDNNGCIGKDSVIVNPKQCMEGLYVPTAFTPNSDGRNDVLKVYLFGNIKRFEFAIYNRWGQPVFKTKDASQGWDGKIAGADEDTGVYVWLCTYQFANQPVKTERGTITVIR